MALLTRVMGFREVAAGVYEVEKIRAAGIDVVRRPTGGRAILHHREITYSVTAPVIHAEPLRDAYARINRILQIGLQSLGVSVEIASAAERAPAPSVRPCFEAPGEGELIARGGKLVGSAQWRDNRALLQHGSILVDDDQSSLGGFAARGRASDRSISAPATLHALLGRSPDASEVASAMFDAVRLLEDAEASELAEDEVRDEASAHVPHFLDEGWTWRR